MCSVDRRVRVTMGWRLGMIIPSATVIFLRIPPSHGNWRRVHGVDGAAGKAEERSPRRIAFGRGGEGG